MDRPDVVSRGVTEGEVLSQVLGEDRTGDRPTDLLTAIHKLEDLVADVPLQLRILAHGLYREYKPANHDVWLQVGMAISREDEPDDPIEHRKWCQRVKTAAWRMAHPYGLEVDVPEDPVTDTEPVP